LSSHPEWRTALSGLASAFHASVFVGTMDSIPTEAGAVERFNAGAFFDSTGAEVAPNYHKRHLVPLFERMPSVIPFIPAAVAGVDYTAGTGGSVYHSSAGRFGVLICFESSFEQLSREYRASVDFLVNISNDAWLAGTGGPEQHAAHLVMRAIEDRV